jgi:amidase
MTSIARIPRPTKRAARFDPDFGTARQAVVAMRRGVISSRELVAHVFARIERHNPRLNLFVTLAREQAMARAKRADDALAKNGPLGKLHGLPVLVKDVFSTAGLRTTAGSKLLEHYVPQENAVAVERLEAAGAIVVGKTNLPEFAGDWQASNELVGTSNNPWDTTRTTGGSTGGGAGALAAGLGFLELGGDLSGSIRIPAHCCGVYGHRPTLDVVPLRGHVPPPPGTPPGPAELPAAGPLARSARDLQLALEVLGGPEAPERTAYRWKMPAPRRPTLREYRIGYVLDDLFCPLDASVREVLFGAVEALRKHGVRLSEGWPAGVDPVAQNACFGWLLGAFLSQAVDDREFAAMSEAARHASNPWLEAQTATHREWLRRSSERLQARAIWQEYFATHDAFLMPVTFVGAFPHDHRAMAARTIATGTGPRPYTDLSAWTSFAALTGCPATVAPVGRTRDGLPVGVQILGPYCEDATTIDIARRLADVTGGFTAPPGFASKDP